MDAPIKSNIGAPRKIFVDNHCAMQDCDRAATGSGYCKKHADRIKAQGDPNLIGKPGPKPGMFSKENHPGWTGDDATYRAIHGRLYREKGKASQHSCIDCGKEAEEWSLSPGDGPRKFDEYYRAEYSVDLDDYDPRCKSCHRKIDYGKGSKK